jgi:uncharacterized protein YbjT (DUF2867 family)
MAAATHDEMPAMRVLLTGATGFVGRHLYPALEAAGHQVACSSRDPERAARAWPRRAWVRLDVDEPASFAPALQGCDAVIYLVHQMGAGEDYGTREARAARGLREAAAAAGVSRIVYLGGVAPTGPISPHLRSRLSTGELLRDGPTPAIELRAGMIVGQGSASWQIVRDLAARLPAMVLPRWLNNRSSPIAIDDVVAALLWALRTPLASSAWYDLPGPEVLTHRALIERVARVLGKHPAMLEVPVVSPRLSSYWIALVTRIGLDLARELVQGLQTDLLPAGGSPLANMPGYRPVELEQAFRNALADEHADGALAPATRHRMQTLGRSAAAARAA